MASVLRIPLAYNSIYLIECAGGRVMVDAGPDYRSARETIVGMIGARAPDVVVATHGHLDHAGLGAWWQARGVPVVIGADDDRLTRQPPLADPPEFRELQRFVEESGAPPDVLAEVLDGLESRRRQAMRAGAYRGYPPPSRDRRWPSGLRYDPFKPDALLSHDGPVGGTAAEAVLLPGHTPGNLVVVEPGEGWLFSGDQLLPEITPTPAIQVAPGESGGGWRFRSLPAFVASLRRLAGMQFSRCFPGHGEPFDNVAEVIRAHLGQVAERNERVLAALCEGSPVTLYALCDRLYPRAVRRRFWQIVATVQGHLDILEAEGRVRATREGYERCD